MKVVVNLMKELLDDNVINYLRSLIPEQDEYINKLAQECIKSHITIIEPEVAQLLVFLNNCKQCSNILEIGTAAGYSAILMGKNITKKEFTITTIERNKKRYSLAEKNITEAKINKNIQLMYGDAVDILPELKSSSYDLIFLDAAKGQYLKMFSDIYRLLKAGGILVADNVLYRGLVIPGSTFHRRKKTMVIRLRKFLKKLNEEPNLITSILPLGDGVAVAVKEFKERC
jgi:predicted O-methyltransferase YrrM